MPVPFNCPSCKAAYEVADDLAGKMIMCRVCKKRGPVRSLASLAAAASSATTMAAVSSAESPSRRSLLPMIGLFLASVGAVGVGALLARQPWDRSDPRDDWKGGPGGRRRGPNGDDKKDGKEGAV